ncbi:hypothetical protein L1887_50685 [Cichorium endivia]|nr:hypothetical protein L1887_50685 [Cichorium endivia]
MIGLSKGLFDAISTHPSRERRLERSLDLDRRARADTQQHLDSSLGSTREAVLALGHEQVLEQQLVLLGPATTHGLGNVGGRFDVISRELLGALEKVGGLVGTELLAAEAGELKDLRRADGAGTEDDLAACRDVDARGGSAGSKFDAESTAVFILIDFRVPDDPGDGLVGKDDEVLALVGDRVEVSVAGEGTLPVVRVDGRGSDEGTLVLAVVRALGLLEADGGESGHPIGDGLVTHARVADRDRAVATDVLAPGGSIAGKAAPDLVLTLAGSDVVEAVDGRGAAEHLTARPARGAGLAIGILQLCLKGGDVLPVEVGADGRLEVGVGWHEKLFVVAVARVAGFDDGDGDIRVFRQATGEGETSRSASGNDVVKHIVGHLFVRFGDGGARLGSGPEDGADLRRHLSSREPVARGTKGRSEGDASGGGVSRWSGTRAMPRGWEKVRDGGLIRKNEGLPEAFGSRLGMRMLKDEEAVGMVGASRLRGSGAGKVVENGEWVWRGEGGEEGRGRMAMGWGWGGEGEGRQRQRRVICSDELEAPGWLRRQRSVGLGRSGERLQRDGLRISGRQRESDGEKEQRGLKRGRAGLGQRLGTKPSCHIAIECRCPSSLSVRKRSRKGSRGKGTPTFLSDSGHILAGRHRIAEPTAPAQRQEVRTRRPDCNAMQRAVQEPSLSMLAQKQRIEKCTVDRGRTRFCRIAGFERQRPSRSRSRNMAKRTRQGARNAAPLAEGAKAIMARKFARSSPSSDLPP